MNPPDSNEKRRTEAQYQSAVKNFEAAVCAFQKQNYEKAREIFEKLTASPTGEVAVRAEAYLRICERKLNRPQPIAKTAADLYNLGIAQLNLRQLEGAVESLKKAYALSPNLDYVRYALAAAQALQGNVDAALEHLKAAVELRPANRFLASKDEDFQSLAADPRFGRLLRSASA
jgi:tetratricopeptide (TPR) repeat protein